MPSITHLISSEPVNKAYQISSIPRVICSVVALTGPAKWPCPSALCAYTRMKYTVVSFKLPMVPVNNAVSVFLSSVISSEFLQILKSWLYWTTKFSFKPQSGPSSQDTVSDELVILLITRFCGLPGTPVCTET